MKSVLRLNYLYFAAGGWRRWLLMVGLVTTGYSLLHPPTTGQAKYFVVIAFAGVTALFLGSSLMPDVVYRLSRSHLSCVLPFGRVRILTSALLTTAVLSFPLPALVALTMMTTFPEYGKLSFIEFMRTPIFVQTYVNVFWICSVLYCLQCLFTITRSIKGFVGTMIIIVALVAMPQRLFAVRDEAINVFPIALTLACWTTLALYVFFWPRLRQIAAPAFIRHLRPFEWLSGNAFQVGREVESQLGIGNRWIHCLGVVMAVALVVPSRRDSNAWLFFFALIAIVIGVVSALTTTRSRSLWLRQPWSRPELFANIERLLWGHMGLALLALLLGQFAFGVYAGQSLDRIGVGIALLVLTFATCTYLGFMQTRGLRWKDALLAIGAALMAVLLAAYAGRASANLNIVLGLEVTMGALAVALRYWAKRRWSNLDWMLCKPIRAPQN